MAAPGVPAPNLAPLMGTEVLRDRGGVQYLELTTRSLVNRCDSPRMPFRFTVNPYRGCAMGCRYCYATYTHEYMGITDPQRFHSTVYAKKGGDEETFRRLRAVARKGDLVALGTATDPYQPGEVEFKVTRRFLALASQVPGLRLGITTKGALILRDLDLLQRIRRQASLSVQVSLISCDAELLRRLEPLAPPPPVRLEVMRRLVEEGVDVGLSLAPVLPGLTDGEADLDELIRGVAAVGVKRMFCNVLFLRSPTKEKFLRWVAEESPRYREAYEAAYRDRVYLRGRYPERIRALVKRLREKHGVVTEAGATSGLARAVPAEQLRLWP
jgi:DNA repair photolyase